MSRVVLVTDIDTSLGNQLVSRFLASGDRVFATTTNQDALSSFDQVLGRIRQLEGISSTETSLLLSTFKL